MTTFATAPGTPAAVTAASATGSAVVGSMALDGGRTATGDAAEDLGLAAGARVVVPVKATEVSVALP
ncbi:TOBE domain-containing protein [Dactylosporangium sp. McL0621]|uniref:TOBE domain-containing protein n=1 Tax=Dactylosporangium sp. McL0621 TaxID=3415678 RepID=UPI003CEC63BF